MAEIGFDGAIEKGVTKIAELKPAQSEDMLAVRTDPPIFTRGPHTERGLFLGFVPFHLSPSTDDFYQATAQRGVCDAALFLVTHPDHSVDGLLSHLYPNIGYRRGHAALFDDLIKIEPGDKTFALLLASSPINNLSDEREFELIKDALKRKNRGRGPDVKIVDLSTISSGHASDIVFARKIVNGRRENIIEVTNSDYRKQLIGGDVRDIVS